MMCLSLIHSVGPGTSAEECEDVLNDSDIKVKIADLGNACWMVSEKVVSFIVAYPV